MTDALTADDLTPHVPKDWPDDVVRALAAIATRRGVAAAEQIIPDHRGRAPVALVLDGVVAVEVDDVEVALLGPGAFIGEMSWLEGGPPRGRVRATEPTMLAVFADDALRGLTVVAAHLAAVATRRRATNRAVEVRPVRARPGSDQNLSLRPMWPDDWRRLDAHRDRISARSLERRFFHRPNLTIPQLRRLADVDYRDEFVWVATDPHIAAVGRYGRPVESPDTGEIALLVADDWQGCGVGRLLLGALGVAAHVQGITTLEAIIRSDNAAIRGLLDRHDPTWTSDGEPGLLVGRWSVATMQSHPDVTCLPAALTDIARIVVDGR